MSQPSGERTEKATPRRKREARRKGQIGHTPEIGTWLGMLVASFVIPSVMRRLMEIASGSFARAVDMIGHPDTGTALAITKSTLFDGVEAVAPLAFVVMAIGVASAVIQGGFNFAPQLFFPKVSRLNPLQGIKRVFGPQGLWMLVKSLSKTAVLGVVAYLSVRSLIPTLTAPGSLGLGTFLNTATSAALNLIRWCALAGLIMAFADYMVVHRRNNKSLKMTKQEVKEEMKNSEGNPMLRSALRSRAISIARNRMMADVPDADVVVVNPTHVAVALRYQAGKGAPRVLAKGGDHVAARIREIAERNRIPMVEDVPLARTLYAAVEVGQEIPTEMFEAVARILAFVMTLKARGSAAGTHRVRTLPRPVLR
jgi:flagellar biosynthetic protein FlhB